MGMDATNGSWALAIDFGTSYTSAALAAADGVDLIDLHGDRRVPSLVYLDEDGRLLVGVLAANQSAGAPDRVERTPKARVGRSPILLLGGQAVPVVDAVGALVAAFVEEARRRRGGSAPSAVTFTHPVRWGEHRRRVLLDAAAAAGLDAESARLVEEPVAAAAAFRSERVRPGDLVAVYDLGGGTFDAAVLRVTETGFVVAGPPGGDDDVGGEVFDDRLLAHVGEQVAAVDPEGWQALTGSQERRWRRAHAQLRDQVRLAKETLSIAGQATVYVPGLDRDVLVTRGEFEDLIAADVQRTLDVLDEVIGAAGATAGELAAVYPVGGSSRIPLVANRLQEHYGDRVVTWDDPQAVVALGAARLARHHVELLGEQLATTPPEPVAPPSPPDPEPPPPPPARAEPPPREPFAPSARRWASGRRIVHRSRRSLALLVLVPLAALAAVLLTRGSGDEPGAVATSGSPTATPEPKPPGAVAVGVTCERADASDLGGSVDRECFTRWFRAFDREVAPSRVADDDPPGTDTRHQEGFDAAADAFLRAFNAAFGTSLPVPHCSGTGHGCLEETEKVTYRATDQPYTVSGTGMGFLVRSDQVEADVESHNVVDVALTDADDPVFPEDWEPGVGLAEIADGSTSDEEADTGSDPGEQPGPSGGTGPGAAPTGPADLLRSYIPDQMSDCTRFDLSETSFDTGRVGLECFGAVKGVDEVSYVLYDSRAALVKEFTEGDDLPQGDCQTGWNVQDTLTHDGKDAGRLQCYDDSDGEGVLEWVNENLNVYVYMMSASGSRKALWREFVNAGPVEP